VTKAAGDQEGLGLNLTSKPRASTPALAELLATPAPAGTLYLYWLGQAGFAICSPETLILVDPYLSDFLAKKYRNAHFQHDRMHPPPVAAEDLRGVNYLFSSHAHSDHLDPEAVGVILANNPGCRLVCPASAREKAIERGARAERLFHPDPYTPVDFAGFRLEMLPSAHEDLARDAAGNYLYAGFILEVNGIRLYHSGDCVPYPELPDQLRKRQVEVALLPVNGRDAERSANGVPGNFSVEEAVILCQEAAIPILIPHHFGLFAFNTVAPEDIKTRVAAFGSGPPRVCVPDIYCVLTLARPSPSTGG
jgi:L-ascorbate metabolism protein UlaG (beta-lactamase superfamily)